MSFAEIWSEFEDSEHPGGAGRLRRRVHGDSAIDLYVELSLPDRTRILSLRVPGHAAGALEELPQGRGIGHVLQMADGGHAVLTLELADPAGADIFSALTEDVAKATAATAGPPEAVGTWISQFSRWQRLLRNAPFGLTDELQRALYAELWVMRELLAPALGAQEAVLAWRGPDRASHDYQLAAGSLEVKSCAANQPQVVRINGERQLDNTGTDSLHLVHISLDIHRPGVETLIEMVDSVRALVVGDAVETALEDLLMDAGYLDEHSVRYRRLGYDVRDARFFRVAEGFPRLIESDLPEGVGGVGYRLAIAACAPFEVERNEILQTIGGSE